MEIDGNNRPPLGDCTLTVVIPCYNEEAVLKATHRELLQHLGQGPFMLKVIFVDDGSRDTTREIIREFARTDPRFTAITLTRNFGHQAAVTAGIAHAESEMTVVMDADLQDPPEAVLTMVERWQQGFDVVNAVRVKRKEPIFLKASYALFYRIYRPVVDIDVPIDSGDFCLMDQRVTQALNRLPEKNRFVRGLRSWVGFRQTEVKYERSARAAGETKYSLARLVRLAFDGIFNFSFKPLSFLLYSGVLLFCLAMLLGLLFVISRLTGLELLGQNAAEVPGFTTLAILMLFFGSVQLLSVGILGEYLSRIYQEVKQRPVYMIDEVVSSSDE